MSLLIKGLKASISENSVLVLRERSSSCIEINSELHTHYNGNFFCESSTLNQILQHIYYFDCVYIYSTYFIHSKLDCNFLAGVMLLSFKNVRSISLIKICRYQLLNDIL